MSEKKTNWKKIGLIVGIIFLIIVAIIISVKVFTNLKNKRILKKEQEKALLNQGGNNTTNTGSGNNSGSGSTTTTGTGSTTTTNTSATPYASLKVGDKLFSIGVTNLYDKPIGSAGAKAVLVSQDGNYVGQVLQATSGGTLKVRLYGYTGGNLGYEFYAPAKAYTVNNA